MTAHFTNETEINEIETNENLNRLLRMPGGPITVVRVGRGELITVPEFDAS